FFADLAPGTRLSLPTEEQSKRLKELDEGLKSAKAALDEGVRGATWRQPDWEKQIVNLYEIGELSWRSQRPVSAEAINGAKLTIYRDEAVESNFWAANGSTLVTEHRAGDGLIVADGPNPDNETYVVILRPGKGDWTALGIDVHQEEGLPGALLARGADRFVL